MDPTDVACKHIDGGFGWVIVCCSFILQGVSAGLSLSVGVFFVEWLEYFGESSSKTAWVGSINTGLLFACGPIISMCIHRLGHRYVALFGSVLASIGLLLSAFCQELWQLCLTYGLITGVGLSSMFIPASIICSEYFLKLRPLSMGIAASGVGLFCLVLPIATELLIQYYGWRTAIIIMSAMSVQSCLFSYLLLPASFWTKRHSYTEVLDSKNPCEQQSDVSNECLSLLTSVCDASFVLTIKFVLFFINNILWNAASLIILVFLVRYASSHGIAKQKGAVLISITGLCSLVGRLGSGAIGNLLKVRRLWIFNVATLLTAIGIGGLPLFSNFAALSVLCAMYGLGFGAQIGVLGISLIELFGVHKLTTAFGYIMISHGIGALCGPPLGGWLYEETGGYSVPFYFAAAISLLAVVILCIIQIIEKRKSRQNSDVMSLDVTH